ncbi:hypothetical protein P8452_72588 [Trifolium repens]|nr:hypothetical protein P8452_72588 [Trifolium repens]
MEVGPTSSKRPTLYLIIYEMAIKKREISRAVTEKKSKFRKINNPNNNNMVAAVENVNQAPNVQEDFSAQLLNQTRHTNQLLIQICKKLDVIKGLLALKEKKMERSNE